MTIRIAWLHIFIFLLLIYDGVKGQSVNHTIPGENIRVLTDRTLYVSGEQIRFAAFVYADEAMAVDASHVVYVELISPGGKSFARGKVSIVDGRSPGCLKIPDDLVTGVYYLKTYTKYMRNFGPEGYAYVPLKIVNPLLDEVLSGTENNVFSNAFTDQLTSPGPWTITMDKKEYAPRENVQVELSKINSVPISEDGVYSVTVAVIPEYASSDFTLSEQKFSAPQSVEFYPETRGISLTGQLKNESPGDVSGRRVNLSIIGEGREFMATETDSEGRYFFSLPDYTGYRDLFLCLAKEDSSRSQLLVDNDFCSLPVHLPAPPFNLTPDERTVAYRMAVNFRIHDQFDTDTILCPNPFEKDIKSFYGTPSDIIRLDEYIALPSLEEYFYELGGAVNVKKKNGKRYFKVLGTQPEMTYFDPLVLVDYVAVSNPDKILSASPASIDRIEVINVPYVKGDITYGGIVSIISKKGDFGGIDLPSSGIFLNYLFLTDSCSCHHNEVYPRTMPDTRNVLYWNPYVMLSDDRASFSFLTSNTPGRYVIVVRLIKKDGSVVEQEAGFEVKRSD